MNEELFYLRQTNLKEVGLAGQQKLKNAKVLIVGAGGLGHPSSIYLAAAGIGKLGILDFDIIEASNLNRQIAFEGKDLGLKKAIVLSEKLKLQNPFIKVVTHCEKIGFLNIEAIFKDYDIILDCTDNLKTKFLIHDYCWHLRKDLIQASIYQYEGQIQSFFYSKNRDLGCLRCLWPKIPKSNTVKNCQDSGVIGSVAGTLGTMQASETINFILSLTDHKENKTKIVNLLDLDIQTIRWKKDDKCKLCSESKLTSQINLLNQDALEAFELKGLDHENMILVDIRETLEVSSPQDSKLKSAIQLPNSEYESWKTKLDSKIPHLFFCQKGHRSYELVKKLKKEIKEANFYSLYGGLDSVFD